MADAVKAQKLAAARKKLKEYQKTQSSKKVIKKDDEENVDPSEKFTPSGNITPTESMASSTHSILDPSVITQENEKNISDMQPVSDLFTDNNSNVNFFSNTLFQKNENNVASNYFDTMSADQSSNPSNIMAQVSNIHPIIDSRSTFSYKEDKNVSATYADPFDPSDYQQKEPNINYFMTQSSNQSNQIDVHAIQTISEENNTQSSTKQMTPEREKSESALEENSLLTNQNNIFSNTESLRQLSSQLNSLIDTDITKSVTGISELEKRNQDLASSLKNEQLKTEQLNLQLREYMTRVTQLESELKQMKTDCETKISRETGPLQEQLQYHVQTVGILVGEKTELTIALNQSQTTAKQKTAECEELQGRLKASRHRVAELEKEVNFLKSTKKNFNKHEQEQNRELERLKFEYNLLKEQHQETTEESSELREKLNAKINECSSLQQEMQDKNSQLSLAQLKIQQLTNGESIQIESQLEMLNQQKISLEQQLSEMTQNIKIITAERDQASQQYQQYVQQLNGQIQNLAESLDTKNIENENLSKREQSLIKHIGELEKHLQNLQSERETFKPKENNNDNGVMYEEMIHILRNEKSELEEKFSEEMNKRNELESQVQKKEELILELETKLEHLKDQPDASKLVAAMESDKIAASRAVEQNKKLKKQLEELHDGFIKMSNSKLELTEKLQSEQHMIKELSEKLAQNTSAVEHLHSVIATKDKELTEVQNRETELQKQVLQQNQLSDRLRHYEAQGNTSDFIQQELHLAKQTVEKLTAENEILTSSLKKLQEERDISGENLTENVAELEKNELTQRTEETNISTTEVNLNMERAMQQLEERFKKTMIEVAELTEEKYRLEHLVLQLQSETETIGEYVTLYQCQRAMLKEKTLEKDEQLKRLSQDREEMKVKLDELNALVQKLILEKEILPKELLHHNLLQNKNAVCDIHKKENEESENSKNKVINGNSHDNNNENYGTAGKIINLLSEIKTSNLVQPSDNIQNFHPCPWCSGQLITV